MKTFKEQCELSILAVAKKNTTNVGEIHKIQSNESYKSKPVTTHLPFLVNDGYGVLQLHIVEETGQEDIGNANQTVIFLLVKEWVCSAEI